MDIAGRHAVPLQYTTAAKIPLRNDLARGRAHCLPRAFAQGNVADAQSQSQAGLCSLRQENARKDSALAKDGFLRDEVLRQCGAPKPTASMSLPRRPSTRRAPAAKDRIFLATAFFGYHSGFRFGMRRCLFGRFRECGGFFATSCARRPPRSSSDCGATGLWALRTMHCRNQPSRHLEIPLSPSPLSSIVVLCLFR